MIHGVNLIQWFAKNEVNFGGGQADRQKESERSERKKRIKTEKVEL